MPLSTLFEKINMCVTYRKILWILVDRVAPQGATLSNKITVYCFHYRTDLDRDGICKAITTILTTVTRELFIKPSYFISTASSTLRLSPTRYPKEISSVYPLSSKGKKAIHFSPYKSFTNALVLTNTATKLAEFSTNNKENNPGKFSDVLASITKGTIVSPGVITTFTGIANRPPEKATKQVAGVIDRQAVENTKLSVKGRFNQPSLLFK